MVTESQKDRVHFLIVCKRRRFSVVACPHLRERRPEIRLRSQANFLVTTGNRPFPSSTNSNFQNEAKCKTLC